MKTTCRLARIGFLISLLVAMLIAACNDESNIFYGGDGDMEAPPVEDGDMEMDTEPAWLDGDWDLDAPPVAVSSLSIVTNPNNVLSFYVSWKTDSPSPSILDVSCADGEYEALIAEQRTRIRHEAFVMGGIANRNCTIRVHSAPWCIEGENCQTETITVSALPDFLPQFDVSELDDEKIQRGWTLFNLANHFEGLPLSGVMVDGQGRIRWYHQRAVVGAGNDTEYKTIDGGREILIGGDRKHYNPVIINWEGNILWNFDILMHHDIRIYEHSPGYIYYLDNRYACTGEISEFPSGVIVKREIETQKEVWTWEICEHFTPDHIYDDWEHLNTIEPFGDGEHILVSARDLHTLFKVSEKTGEIKWQIGRYGSSDVPADAVFYRQHSPEIQRNGNILLFDNGHKGYRPYSRALEIKYDEIRKRVDVVWSYRPPVDIFCEIWGDADRLPNGNTLITFGLRDEGLGSHLIEVTPDKRQVWHLNFPAKWGVYRAQRIYRPLKGHIVTN